MFLKSGTVSPEKGNKEESLQQPADHKGEGRAPATCSCSGWMAADVAAAPGRGLGGAPVAGSALSSASTQALHAWVRGALSGPHPHDRTSQHRLDQRFRPSCCAPNSTWGPLGMQGPLSQTHRWSATRVPLATHSLLKRERNRDSS